MRISAWRSEGDWHQAGLVVVVGLATGALTQIAQSVLPDGWSQGANAISPWLLVAFLIGAVMPNVRWAAGAGAATLILALVGYYGITALRYSIGGAVGSWVFWGLGALVGGPVFGVAGYAWRTGSSGQRAIAVGLLVAVAVAEGIYHWTVLSEPAVGAGFIGVGIVVPIVFGRSRDDRIGAYVAALPALGLGALGYVAFLWLNGLTSAI